MFPSVSVIIPAYNEGSFLRECLGSLCAQDYPKYEIILVDNGSTDATKQICEEFPTVKYVYYTARKSSYAARNEGVRRSSGEVIAFFDADQAAAPDMLLELLRDFEHGNHRHVYQGELTDDERIPEALRRVKSLAVEQFRCGPDPWAISTACVALPKQFFEELGGFKEYLVSGGDREFFGRAGKKASLHRTRRPVGTHYWASSIREHLKREERYAFGDCLRRREDGLPLPSLARTIRRLCAFAPLKVVAALVVPIRYPVREWTVRWTAQWVHWCSIFYEVRGLARFRLGYRRAGDLPADATARRVIVSGSGR